MPETCKPASLREIALHVAERVANGDLDREQAVRLAQAYSGGGLTRRGAEDVVDHPGKWDHCG